MRMDEQIKRLIEKYTLEATRLSGHEALERYSMAYAQAKELGNGFTIRACASNLGAMYISLGKKEDAENGLKYLAEAMPPDGVSDSVSNGDLFFNLGLGCQIAGQLREAHRYFEQAWSEYRSERDNVRMEIDTLKRLVQLSQVRQEYGECVRWNIQLEETYSQTHNPVDQMLTMQQRVALQKQLGQEDVATDVIDKCRDHMDTIRERGLVTVGILVHTAVFLAKFAEFQTARNYLQEANSLLGVEHSQSLEKAVVLQNLGTISNYLEDWDTSLPYHHQAAAIYQNYASLPPDPKLPIKPLAALRCQGHCVANHAYALVKTDDVDEARVLFTRALELANQCNDHDTKWQMEEALGAVHFRLACHDLDLPSPRDAKYRIKLPASRLKHLEKSLDWYKRSLMDLANSSQKKVSSVGDRVLEKFTLVKNFMANAALTQPGEMAELYGFSVQVAPKQTESQAGQAQQDANRKEAESSSEEEEDDDEEENSGESVEEEESSEENEQGLPLGRTMKRQADDDEDDDREQMSALMKAQLDKGDTLRAQKTKQMVQADVHTQQTSSSAESGSSEDDDDEDDSETSGTESEGEDDDENDAKGRNLPPMPTQSPPPTFLPSGTYETPQAAEMQINQLYGDSASRPRAHMHGKPNYAEIDFEASDRQRSGECVSKVERRARPNFFVSSSDEESGAHTKQKTPAGGFKGRRQDPDYEPVEMGQESSRITHTDRYEEDEDETVDFEMGGRHLSDKSHKDQKESKTCTIM